MTLYLPVEVPMQYKVARRSSDQRIAVSVLGLPGCRSRGITEAGALDNLRIAIVESLSAVDEQLRGEGARVFEVAA